MRKLVVQIWVLCKDQWALWDLEDLLDHQVLLDLKVFKGIPVSLANLVLLALWVPVVLPALLESLVMMVKLENLARLVNVDLQDLRVPVDSPELLDFLE